MAYVESPKVKGYLKKGEGFGATYEGIVIVAAKRTPFCRICGPLSLLSATDLGILATKGALKQAGISPEEIDYLVFGMAGVSSGDTFFAHRHIALYSGMGIGTPAMLVQKICTSGMEALINAAEHIANGKVEVAVAGGSEGLSQSPTVLFGNRLGYKLRDVKADDYLWEAFYDTSVGFMMAETAENLAEKYRITRKEADEYAFRSHSSALRAQKEGFFKDEIEPIEECTLEAHHLKPRKIRFYDTKAKRIEADDGPRETSLEKLAALPPVFRQNGVQTAGNSSQITDGAGALVVCDARWAEKRGFVGSEMCIRDRACCICDCRSAT
ncbi:MAG: thiolase family protein [Planctomycetota bacterium]|nr:thiolase family protein [Planctomycetota bacterium]